MNLKDISVKLTSGEASVGGITIGNPKNYKSKNLFSLDEIDVKLNIASLTTDTIIIDKIEINKPVITYEMLSLTQNNISDVLNNIKKNTASAEKDNNKTATQEQTDSESSKKVVIKSLLVNGGQVEVMAGVGTLKKPISVVLPKIEMKNIGEEKQGASIAETLSTVLQKILGTAETSAVSALTDIGNTTAEGVKSAGKGVVDAGEKAVSGIKGLFN